MYCSQCGTHLGAGASFCSECRRAIEADTALSEQPVLTAETQPRTTPEPPSAYPVGSRIEGRFEIELNLDGGCLRASDSLLSERVRLLPLPERFSVHPARKQMRNAVARLHELHVEGVVEVFEFVERGRDPFLTLELLEGFTPLTERVAQQGHLAPGEVRRVGIALLKTLARAHAKGLSHGALDDRAVWLDPSGQVKLFGLEFGMLLRDDEASPAANPSTDAEAFEERRRTDLVGVARTLLAAAGGSDALGGHETLVAFLTELSDEAGGRSIDSATVALVRLLTGATGSPEGGAPPLPPGGEPAGERQADPEPEPVPDVTEPDEEPAALPGADSLPPPPPPPEPPSQPPPPKPRPEVSPKRRRGTIAAVVGILVLLALGVGSYVQFETGVDQHLSANALVYPAGRSVLDLVSRPSGAVFLRLNPRTHERIRGRVEQVIDQHFDALRDEARDPDRGWQEVVRLAELHSRLAHGSWSEARRTFAEARMNFEGENYAAARSGFESLRQAPGIQDLAANGVGRSAWRMGDTLGAIAGYRAAIDANPQWVFPHQNLGSVFYLMDRVADSEAQFRQAIRIDPARSWNHYMLGELYFRHERFREAHISYREAERLARVEADPGYSLDVVRDRILWLTTRGY